MSLASAVFDGGDIESSIPLYVEASRAAMDKKFTDIFTLTETQRQIAILKGIRGDHKGAVAHLEKLQAITRTASLQYPSLWYAYLNSLAVELGEVGRIEEARDVCKIVLATPYASAYPEWRETGRDLSRRAYCTPRSFLSLSLKASPARNVVPMPARANYSDFLHEESSPKRFQQGGTVTNLEDWKQTKMAIKPNGNKIEGKSKPGRKAPTEMDDKDMLMRVMEIFSSPEISEGKRRQMIESIENIISEKDED